MTKADRPDHPRAAERFNEMRLTEEEIRDLLRDQAELRGALDLLEDTLEGDGNGNGGDRPGRRRQADPNDPNSKIQDMRSGAYADPKSPPRITGYTVSNNVQVRVRDLTKLGAILDEAIGAGANAVNGVEFIVSKESELLDGARKSAVEDARRKAALYAEAAGAKLGPITTLSEQTIGPPPRPMYRMEAASAAPVPIEAGETTLRVEITATYALE